MKIKSLCINNVKCYSNADIKFSPKINLLIGENNSGKSTIIRCLLNLQYRAFDKKDIRSGANAARTLTQLSNVTKNDIKLFEDPKIKQTVTHNKSIDVFWQLGVTPSNTMVEENLFADSSKKLWEFNGDSKQSRKGTQAKQQFNTFPLFPDMENKANFIFPFLAKRKTEFYDSSINLEQYFKIQEGMRNIAARIHRLENPSHPRHDRFVSLCQDILGFKIGVIPMDQQNGNAFEPGMYVTSTQMIPIKSMGEGVVNILGFIVTLLTEDNKLILVEELENDIHPKALKQLLSLIVEKCENNQFVISTHSHIVLKYLGALRETKIFYTSTINDFAEQRVPTSKISLMSNDPSSRIDVLEKLGYEFNDFDLHSAYLLLEESSAETVISGFLIPNFFPQLFGKIKLIAARGVDDLEERMTNFNRLFVFVHTSPIYYRRAWVIADGDESGLNCISNLKKKFSSWPADHFLNLSYRNFEEYYPKRFQEKVEAALSLKGEKKQRAKTELLLEVMHWALQNREEAVAEFRTSCAEVINILEKIQRNLSRRRWQPNPLKGQKLN